MTQTQVGFTLAIDLTQSMRTVDCPPGVSRSAYACARIPQLLTALQAHQIDRLDLIGFGTTSLLLPDLPLAEVIEQLQAMRARDVMTRTDLAIASSWLRHLQRGSAPSVLVVITDGPPALAYGMDLILNEILSHAEPGEFAIYILSVGNRSDEFSLYFAALESLEPEIDLITTGALETTQLDALVSRHCDAKGLGL